MADIFDFYVKDNRTIQFNLTEPIMLEDSYVSDWVFHIPKVLNNIDMSGWAWWLVYINARGQKYSELLTLSEDPESPLEKCIATYTVDYSMSIRAGVVRFSLEAINADTQGTILNEWHTQTYQAKVQDTLQGNQVEYAETESDIISALIVEVQNKVAQLVGGATPEPVSLIADMTDTKKVYLYVGSETGESTNYWYYHNGTRFVPGGLYASGITIDAVPTQGSTNAVSSGGVYEALHDTDTTLTQSGQAADAKVVGKICANLQNGMYSGNIIGEFVRGSLNFNTIPWVNGTNLKQISTKADFVFHLYKGDIITIDDFTDKQIYIINKKADGAGGWVSGWSNAEISVPFDGEYGLIVRSTGDDFTSVDDIEIMVTTSGMFDRTAEIPHTSDNAEIAKEVSYANDRRLSAYDGSLYISSDAFEIGNLTIPQMTYPVSQTRIRTKQGQTIPLKSGDVITLSTGVFYWGYYDTDGVMNSGGRWVSNLEVEYDGDYVFCMRYSTESTITDFNAFMQGFAVKTYRNDVQNNVSTALDLFRFERFYDHMLLNKINGSDVIIPLQSIPSIFMSKRLGFKVIEANVRKTSDNKYIVTHGTNGAFGTMFEHIDGETDISATMINNVTLTWIQTNVRYKSLYAKYKTAPPTLEEYLTVCKKLKMIPLLQIGNDSDIATIANNIMGKDNYIAYNSNRQINNGFIMIWRDLTTKAAIIEECNTYGKPLMYGMANPSYFSDADLKGIVEELHANGYLIGFQDTYISEPNANKYMQMGFDFCATTWNINDIDCGNVLNVSGDIDFSEFEHNGTVVDGNLILANGQYVRKWGTSQKPLLGMVCYVRFSGTLKVNMSGNFRSGTYTSDGNEYVRISAGKLLGTSDCMLTSTGTTTIYELKMVASAL